MARNCKCGCLVELPPASKCEDIVSKKGYASIKCSADHAKSKREAKQAKEVKQRNTDLKKKVKSENRGLCVKTAQTAFNAFIRERDKGLACISCGRQPNYSDHIGGSGIHAGHYRSVGACPELRFEELNVNIQCVHCNIHKSGNAIDYRIGLIKKIGAEKVEWIEGSHNPKKYSIEDLREIAATYKAKLNAYRQQSIQ